MIKRTLDRLHRGASLLGPGAWKVMLVATAIVTICVFIAESIRPAAGAPFAEAVTRPPIASAAMVFLSFSFLSATVVWVIAFREETRKIRESQR